MTREEAIEMLMTCEAESTCGHYAEARCCYGCNQREALDMAIEALNQQGQPYICPQCGKVFGEPYHNLVRCGECVHADDGDCPIPSDWWVYADDYCSWGERREP